LIKLKRGHISKGNVFNFLLIKLKRQRRYAKSIWRFGKGFT